MKKITILLCLIILIFSLYACDKPDNDLYEPEHIDIENNTDVIDTQTQNNTATDENQKDEESPSEPTTPQEPSEPIETRPAGEYVVTFDYGYDDKKTTEYSQNYKISRPVEPIRDGCVFQGWYAEGETEQWNFSGHAVTSDMTLTARWGKYVYYIEYFNVVNEKETEVFKEPIQIPIDSTDDGTDEFEIIYGVVAEFKGYSLVNLNGDDPIFNYSNGKVVSTSYFQNYTKHSFLVPTTFAVDSETFTVPELHYEGFEFLGWTYPGQTTPVKTVIIPTGTMRDISLTANWKSK